MKAFVIKWLKLIDQSFYKLLTGFCMLLLLAMVSFTIYTVIMRYVFSNPPVWGDLLTVLSNIWLVFIALALSVRERQHIALNLIYSSLPKGMGFFIQQFWTFVILALGIVIFYYGLEVYDKMHGKYWEMWHFTWENGLVFQSNYMPKRYAVVILPLSGMLMACAAVIAIAEDICRYKNNQFQLAQGSEVEED